MALTESDLSELLAALKAGEMTDTIRSSLEWILQQLIEAEATAVIGAAPHERTETRTAQRNGHRPRLLSTPAGDVELEIPKLRQGSFFPSLLERRRRIDRALFAVVMEAYVHGVSTRKVDDLVKALGVGERGSPRARSAASAPSSTGTSRRSGTGRWITPSFVYVFLDATYVKGRVRGRVVSRAVVIATGVTATGDREVLGIDVGDSEDGAFWTAFLKGLRARGLTGVQLVISDHHLGLETSHRRRCSSAPPGSAAGCTSCATSSPRSPRPRPRWSPPPSARSSPSPTPPTSAPSSTRSPACSTPSSPTSPPCSATPPRTSSPSPRFPIAHWRKIWSTNPLERINGEIKRRTNVVGIFPNDASILRLVTAVLVETHDEWAVAERRYLSEESMAKIGQPATTVEEAPLAITA